MRRRFSRQATLATALVVSLIAGACSAGGGTDQAAGQTGRHVAGGTFTWAIDDRGVFDPYRNSNIEIYAKLAYDSLVNQRPDGTFVSGLADKWTVTADRATFTLRRGVTCSDGTPLTAGQIAADLTYLSDPKNKSYLYGLRVPTVPLTAAGDDAAGTVTVTLRKPFSFLLQTIGQVPIVCAKGMRDPELLRTASDGTGPFVLTEVVPGQRYTFAVRKDYTWGPAGASTSAPGTPASLVLSVVENEATKANLLQTGQVNMAVILGEDRQRLTAQGLTTVEAPSEGAWLWFNQQHARPGADQRVRQALVQALDLAEVVKVNTGGFGRAATGLVNTKTKPCPGDTVAGRLPAQDVAAAERLLDAAGWVKDASGTRSKGGRPLVLALHYWAGGGSTGAPTAELLSRRWGAIGVRVKVTADTTTAYTKVMFGTGDYDVYQSGFGLDLPSQMVNFLSGPVPPAGTNVAGIDNADYARLAATAATLPHPQACRYWDQAEQALYRAVNPVPIAVRSRPHFLRNAEAAAVGIRIVPTSLRVLG